MASESIQRETLVIIIVINWLIAFLLHLPLDLPPQTTMPSPTSLSMDCQCSTRLIVLRLPLVLFWPTYLSYYHCWPKPLNCRYSSPSGVRWLRHCLCVYHCWYHPSLLWLVRCTHGAWAVAGQSSSVRVEHSSRAQQLLHIKRACLPGIF